LKKEGLPMNNGKVNWTGNFPAVVTPFTKDGAIDEKKFVENIELLMSEGIHGAVVSGCNGEAWALEPEERVRLFELAVKAAKGRIPVIAGTGGIVTGHVVALSKAAKEAGADGVMVLPPPYAMISAREAVNHYRIVSDEAKIPILIYNVPRRTGINLTPDVMEQLAEIEYVVAVKEACDDFVQVQATLAAVGERVRVFTGKSAARGMAAVMAGAVGFVSSQDPHVMGREGISLYELSAKGDIEGARRVQMRTLKLNKTLSPIGTDPANMKAAMNLLGRPGGHVRLPMLDLTAAELERVEGVLDALGLRKSRVAA
jgi:4-hydroxy-tetrahydrodipicolinate synthase